MPVTAKNPFEYFFGNSRP